MLTEEKCVGVSHSPSLCIALSIVKVVLTSVHTQLSLYCPINLKFLDFCVSLSMWTRILGNIRIKRTVSQSFVFVFVLHLCLDLTFRLSSDLLNIITNSLIESTDRPTTLIFALWLVLNPVDFYWLLLGTGLNNSVITERTVCQSLKECLFLSISYKFMAYFHSPVRPLIVR